MLTVGKLKNWLNQFSDDSEVYTGSEDIPLLNVIENGKHFGCNEEGLTIPEYAGTIRTTKWITEETLKILEEKLQFTRYMKR